MTRQLPWPRRPPVPEALRVALGSPTLVRRLGSSPRSRVWQVEFDGAPAIVKQIVGPRDADERYRREVTALRLAGRVRPPVVPTLLGTDAASRILVLEHLSTRSSSDGDWVIDYATALARLHAASVPADANPLPTWHGPSSADIEAFLGLARQLEVTIPDGTSDELDALITRLDRSGERALMHGDPCPDNALHTRHGVRFIDLEQAALGPGIVELAYLRMGFPSCWCVTAIPPMMLDDAESAYSASWRSVTHTEPPHDLADACAGWLIRGDALVERAERGRADHLARLVGKDWQWGTVTARQRLLHRLRVVAAVTAERGELAGVARLTRTMQEHIVRRWPALGPVPIASGNPLIG